MALWALGLFLGWNWNEHKHDRPTACSITRRLPKPVVAVSYPVGAVALFVHVWRGYTRDARQRTLQ